MRRPGSGNGFVRCSQGHTHWGRLGAAGLLLAHDGASLLQHRAPWTHEGGTWSIPGGARDRGEDAVTAALREAAEEAGLAADDVVPTGWSVADHGGWSYTTVVARVPDGRRRPDPTAVDASHADESTAIRWWPDDAVDDLPQHAGFAAAWPRLRARPAPLVVVVDLANVMGSRPDGWWRDRAGAATRWQADLTAAVAGGWPAADLPAGVDPGGLDALTPRLRIVREGAARGAAAMSAASAPPAMSATPADATPDWARALVRTVDAPGSGDDTVVTETANAAASGAQVLVVTADRELRERVRAAAPAAVLVGPGTLTALLTAPPSA